MKIAVVVKPNNGCDFYRIVLPMEYLPWKENGDTVKLFLPDGTSIPNPNELVGFISEIESFEPDLIFYNRDVPGKTIEWLEEQKKKGIKLVMDIDDYWELSVNHPVHFLWYRDKMNQRVIDNLKIVDLVLCTTEVLRKKILDYNKNCLVIPNAVPFGEPWYKQTGYKGELADKKMNFLYAGGSTHYQDILLLKNTFTKIGGEKAVTNRAKFTLAGFNPLPDKHCEWDKMASVFSRTNSYEIRNTLPIQAHMFFYDTADVVLIPLVNNEFNRYKSELKIIEAATRELPCIVSKTLPYSELDYPGILWDDWQKNIKYFLNNPKEVVSLGKQLAEKVKQKYDIRVWSISRYQIFKHLIDKK